MKTVAAALLFLCAIPLDAQRVRAVRGAMPDRPVRVHAEPASCPMPPAAQELCADGGTPANSIAASEVEAIVRAAVRSLNEPMTVAVVDRAGRPLAVAATGAADPLQSAQALGVARTAAFFSHNQAPLSSRTVRFISGIHFPPGITNTPSAALYGIENTNRGCDLNVAFNEGKCIPRARALNGTSCAPGNTAGCGTGIVTGKVLPDDRDASRVNAGGIPLYRVQASGGRVFNPQLLGAIGIAGIAGDPQRAEYAAVSGAFGSLATGIAPVPFYPLPHPGNVFIDGIRLPFLGPDLRLTFNSDGLPMGVRLDGVSAGSDAALAFEHGPFNGGCAANEYLVGPIAGAHLSAAEVDAIVQRAVATARRTRAGIRLPLNCYARMVIAVADTNGDVLALYRMPDATVFSVDVAVAKSRNVVYFSRNGIAGSVPRNTAVSNRTIGFGAQPFFPPGIDSEVFDPAPGPWYASLFLKDLATPCSQGDEPPHPNQNGIVFFAGSTPLYRGNTLIGGLGVSGDGIEQDDYVTWHAAGEFLPIEALWADRVFVRDVRLPMFKFPRHPEGVEE